MEGRVVISFRATGGPERAFLSRARALDARATASGGVLVAWDATRVAFAFDPAELEEVIALATSPEPGDDPPWAVGVAEGPLERLSEDGARGELAWGPALVAASALALSARPGEIACAESMRAVRSGDLLAVGARVGREGGVRVRGVRLDRASPWRAQAVARLSHMRVAPLVGVDPTGAAPAAGSLVVLRADPGTGGTRLLSELAATSKRALVVTPSGSGFEPLGALRRALGRSITRDLNPELLELALPLEALLGGDGVRLDVAAKLVAAFLAPAGVILLDDAKALDPASVAACVLAAESPDSACGVVARLDATSGMPSALASLPKAREVELGPLGFEAACALAGACTSEALDDESRRRWARLGANVPLGVVEAVAFGIVTGDIAWSGDRAAPRSRSAGRGKPRSPAEWIALRARDEPKAHRAVLGAVALLGGEAKTSRVARVLDRVAASTDVDAAVAALIGARWLVDTQEDWVALPSRTHKEALSRALEADERASLHAAAAEVIAEEEGTFGRVEAAFHAAQAAPGEGQAAERARAARVLLAAARRAADARLESSTTQLIAFARRTDPSCEEEALELLANALDRAPSLAPPPSTERDDGDSEPPTLAVVSAPRGGAEGEPAAQSSPPTVAGKNLALRLGELVKEALLSADNAALERWVDGLRAAGESPFFTERMRAMARLGRGDIGDALRVLRRARQRIDPKDHSLRCQTSLALGVALSVAGRPQEALLEGMDALARARSASDAHGASACLAFLAKLFSSVGRSEDAARLQEPPSTT